MKKAIINLCYPLFVIIGLIIIWQISSLIIGVDLILPTPFLAFKEMINFFKESSFYISLLNTLLRSFIVILISFIIGFLLSAISNENKSLRKIFNILMSILRSIPTMAIILILVISTTPTYTPIIVALIVMIPTIYENTKEALSLVDKKMLEMAYVYKISKKKIIKNIYIPTIKYPLLSSFSSGFSFSVKLVIAAEALALTKNSIGSLMQYQKIWLETEKLFALTIVTIIVSLIIEYSITFIFKKVWKND